MMTLYFFLFCFGAAFLIYWLLKNDDLAAFKGKLEDRKFRLPNKNQKSDP